MNMQEAYHRLSELVDGLTGVRGSVGYFAIIVALILGYSVIVDKIEERRESSKPPEEPEPPRNFTAAQLQYFDGTKDENTNDDKPVYLSLRGIVFDVSGGREFYGPGGPYATFAGRECGMALAKMSFEEQHLDDVKGCQDLKPSEKSELEGWIDKFTHFRPYPIKGRLVVTDAMPSPDRILTKEGLAQFDGLGPLPEHYGVSPIYVGVGDTVYDVSFGGVTLYGPGGPYNKFAGRDATRALAKMALNEQDVSNPRTDDLTEKELKILDDWIKVFREKKCYPVVGRLSK